MQKPTLIAAASLTICFPMAAGAGVDDVAVMTGWNSASRNVVHADWIALASPLLMPPLPIDGDLIVENPPFIAWPVCANCLEYQLELKAPNGAVSAYLASDNFFVPSAVLANGKYSWRVKPKPKFGISNWSDWRSFSVSSDARPFVLPPMSALVPQVGALAHPRGFPRGVEKAQLLANLSKSLAPGFNELKARVARYYGKPLLNQSLVPISSSSMTTRMLAQQTLALPEFVNRETQQIVEAAWLWQVDNDSVAKNDAKKRIFNLAAWDTDGPTSYSANARAARSIFWALAFGYDALYSELNAAEKATLISAIEARLAQIMVAVDSSSARLGANPYDTTQWVTVEAATAAAALIAGDSARADKWLARLMPWAVHSISPWGGDDGGYGNGTAYAAWTMDSLFYSWDSLRFATGVDVYKKRWLRAFGNYFAYFMPPGSPSGAFGEAAENAPETKYGKALAYRVPLSANQWYGSLLGGDDPSDLITLTAGAGSHLVVNKSLSLPASAVFPSIGWAAMHSSLADKNRTSIYFKSSAFGSFNHSHADQNSFVINAAGKRLAIDSGYYDWYGSPHWNRWYKQTLAHNAITFDGGQGQLVDRKDASGEIADFRSTATYDSVSGNAVKAYGGALTRAQRNMVYLRPDIVLVYDALESAVPRRWEWNIHAINKMNQLSARSIELVNGGARMCVDFLDGPSMAFTQTDQFAADPDKPAGTWARQWHGSFTSSSASLKSEILTLLRVNCSGGDTVTVKRIGTDLKVTVKGRAVTFAPGKTPSVQ